MIFENEKLTKQEKEACNIIVNTYKNTDFLTCKDVLKVLEKVYKNKLQNLKYETIGNRIVNVLYEFTTEYKNHENSHIIAWDYKNQFYEYEGKKMSDFDSYKKLSHKAKVTLFNAFDYYIPLTGIKKDIALTELRKNAKKKQPKYIKDALFVFCEITGVEV